MSMPIEDYIHELDSFTKEDVITILEDLKNKMLFEHTFDTSADKKFQHGMDYARRQDLATVQEKINALRGEENGNDNQQSHGNPNC